MNQDKPTGEEMVNNMIGFIIYKNDKVNSILSAALKHLDTEQLSVLRDALISRTPKPTGVPYWPDIIRELMIEKSEMYQNPSVYQFGYYDGFQKRHSIALPELTAKEEEIKGKNNTISIMNKVINSQIEFIKELKEENAKLKEEVERLKKDVIDVLSENHQAQIAGYYNDDKTDAEREKRNAVIEEYSDLLIIFKARFNSPTTKK